MSLNLLLSVSTVSGRLSSAVSEAEAVDRHRVGKGPWEVQTLKATIHIHYLYIFGILVYSYILGVIASQGHFPKKLCSPGLLFQSFGFKDLALMLVLRKFFFPSFFGNGESKVFLKLDMQPWVCNEEVLIPLHDSYTFLVPLFCSYTLISSSSWYSGAGLLYCCHCPLDTYVQFFFPLTSLYSWKQLEQLAERGLNTSFTCCQPFILEIIRDCFSWVLLPGFCSRISLQCALELMLVFMSDMNLMLWWVKWKDASNRVASWGPTDAFNLAKDNTAQLNVKMLLLKKSLGHQRIKLTGVSSHSHPLCRIRSQATASPLFLEPTVWREDAQCRLDLATPAVCQRLQLPWSCACTNTMQVKDTRLCLETGKYSTN